MRRILTVAALSTLFLTGVAAPAVAAPAPSPSPTASADNTAEVCEVSAKTVTDGLADFVTRMQKVTEDASAGNLAAAEQSVKEAGSVLVTLSDDLRGDAAKATSPALRTALDDLAAEFEKQGTSLDGLPALQEFDTKRLEALAQRLTPICGEPSASPSPSPSE